MTAPAIAPKEDRHSYGIGILVASQLFFAILDSCAKWMALSGIQTFEIVFVRYAVHVALLLALFMPVQGRSLFRTGSWKIELLRGVCLLGTTVCNFFAMQFLPLTVTGALLFTMPLIVCLLSVPLLGETVGWRRGIAIVVGFVGILVIVRPGTAAFHWASLLCIVGAAFAALYSILTRKLAGVDSAATQTMYAGLVSLLAVTPFAFSDWVWPSNPATWVAFLGAGVAGALAHQLTATAHRFASPTVLAPFSYLELLYLALASWIVFGQPPGLWFYIGAPIIIGSGFYIFLREQRLEKPDTALSPVED